MYFADDTMLIDKKRTRLNIKLDLWGKTLEDIGLKISKQAQSILNINLVRIKNEDVISINIDSQKDIVK